MDPVTTAMIAALSAIASGATTELSKRAVGDSYERLKRLLKTKFGFDSDVAIAIDRLERRPDSQGSQTVLAEELSAVGAMADAEVVDVATALIAQIGPKPSGTTQVQIAHGTGIAQATGQSNATVTVYDSPKKNE